MFLVDLYTTLIYQPFFNILVFFYWVLDQLTGGNPDMGIAVILLTILIRIMLLPMSLSGEKTEAERRQIGHEMKELEEAYGSDPIAFKRHKKLLLKKSQTVVVGELISLSIQVMISLMLWRIFATGLTGEDIHLLYPFMPEVQMPDDLLFLGKIDLTHKSLLLNFIQSGLIFVLETLAVYTSPYPPEKGEVVRLQLVLPVVSFFIFLFLPAGKKLFIITALIVSIILVLYKFIRRKFEDYRAKVEAREAAAQEERVVVDVK